MKNYLKFIKEEIDARDIEGLPDDFIRKSDQEAERSLGVRKDDPRQMQQYGPQIMGLIQQSQQLMMTDERGSRLTGAQLSERKSKLEDLVKSVIMDEYGDILKSSEKPVELRIKLVDSGNDVNREIDELRDVPQRASRPEQPERDEDEDEEESQDEESQDKDEESQDKDEDEDENIDVFSAASKKKILNMITQGEGKMTKDIISFSDVVEEGLKDIFGDNWSRILDVWKRTSDVADKMDWIIPISDKASMMKNQPMGMAGACDVTWESLNFRLRPIQYLTENTEYNKIVITAVGIDFPMLIHESVKGIYRLLSSGAIKLDDELAKAIKAATTSFEDEAQDFRYGVAAQKMFNDFINACKDSDKYKQMRARVFAQLALDKDRGGRYTDKKFLDITKSLFSTFDLERGVLTLNKDKFDSSMAKREIEELISDIVKVEDEYEEELRRWEAEQELDKFSQQDDKEEGEDDEFADEVDSDDDIQSLISKTAEREEDLSNLTPRELQDLIDDALDAGDFDEVKRLSSYLKEGREIYLREIERINEKYLKRK
jgi:hypothetical protein